MQRIGRSLFQRCLRQHGALSPSQDAMIYGTLARYYSQWSTVKAVSTPEDPLYSIVGRTGDLVDIDNGWALVAEGVAAQGSVYRNAKLPKLLMSISGCRDASKALHVNLSKPEDPAPSLLSSRHFAKLKTLVTKHLEQDASNVFIEDGGFSSSPKSVVKVRAITDDAATALSLRYQLIRVPLRDPEGFGQNVTILSAGGLRLDDPGAVGAGSSSVIAVDSEEGKILVAGTVTPDALRAAVVYASTGLVSASGSTVVSAHAFLDEALRSSLVFGAPLSAIPPALLGQLYSADYTVWSADGLSRGLSGALLSSTDGTAPIKKNYLIQHFAGSTTKGGRVVFPLDTPAPNVAPAPSSVIFVVDESGASVPQISTLTAEQAQYLFLAGYTGAGALKSAFAPAPADGVAAATSFGALIKESGADAYLVNTHGLDSLAVERLLLDAFSGAKVAVTFEWKAKSKVAQKVRSHVSAQFPAAPESLLKGGP